MASNNKTFPTGASVKVFIDGVASEQKRADSWQLVSLMEDVTGEPATMWGPSIVGFGSYHYEYASGREGDFFLCGFSPRKAAISIYLMRDTANHDNLLARLGKFTSGKSCLYVKMLSDIDMSVLRELVQESVDTMRTTH